jgi:hypothetical protein
MIWAVPTIDLRGRALRALERALAPLGLRVQTTAEVEYLWGFHRMWEVASARVAEVEAEVKMLRFTHRRLREQYEKLVCDASKQLEDDRARIELRDLQLAAAEERTAVLKRLDALCAQMPDIPLVLAARRELDEALGRGRT